MWAIRMLSGSHAGQVIPLQPGKHLVGRGANCQIRFEDRDVSKEHAFLLIDNEHLSVIDNQSRNGTYVNGIMVNKASLKRGDKVSFNQTICDVIQLPSAQDRKAALPTATPGVSNSRQSMQVYQGQVPAMMGVPGMPAQHPSALPSMSPMPHGIPHGIPQETMTGADGANGKDGFLKRYFEEVFLPGIYQLGQVMEFKIVIGLFMLIFAVLVTALSTIPMIAITSDSIQIESRRRALTIARNLANVNQQALLKEMESAVSTQMADLEEGVSQALVIRQSDGTVIAPPTKAGTVPAIPFIETARREQKEMVQQIDSSHIAVAVPLAAFNPETAAYTVKALAVVVYDMGSLAVDDGRTLSLFFQTLIISLILGFGLYYLFYRFVEYPVADLNRQLDLILKNKAEPTTSLDLEFPMFQNLISNVNTLLTRIANPESGQGGMSVNRDLEIINIVRLVGYASLAISSDHNIVGLNSAAEHLLNLSDGQLRNQPITLIPDQALQKSLYDLMEHAGRDPSAPSKNELEFGGENTEINCQAITEKGKVSYYLVTIIPLGGVG